MSRSSGQVADAGQHVGRCCHRVLPEHPHRSLRGPQHAQKVADERRLAGSVFADQTQHAAPRQLKVDIGQGLMSSERTAQPGRLYDDVTHAYLLC